MEIPGDLDTVVRLIYETDKYLFPFLFGSPAKAFKVIKELVQREGNSFSSRYIYCFTEENRVLGILIGYDHREIDEKAEDADFKAVLSAWEQFTLFFKFLILRPFINKDDVTGLYIQNICVESAHRGKGIGSALIRHFCGLHQREVFLDVELSNAQGLKLYERLGFSIQSKKTVLLPGLGSYRMMRKATPG